MEEILENRRKTPDFNQPQKITRIPMWRPGTWVVLGETTSQHPEGVIVQVKRLQGDLGEGMRCVEWYITTTNGRRISVQHVKREATSKEVANVTMRRTKTQ